MLDVACGTGWTTLETARAVGPTGHVIGVDIAEKALSIAQGKAGKMGLDNISFDQQDGHHLKFEDCTFDVVTCASALFGFEDIPGALGEWRRVLRPGGRVAFSSFGPEFSRDSKMTIAKYGTASSPNVGRLDTIEDCPALGLLGSGITFDSAEKPPDSKATLCVMTGRNLPKRNSAHRKRSTSMRRRYPVTLRRLRGGRSHLKSQQI